jgi:hypothetical protein
MDILILESFSYTPHLETAGEIAIRQSLSGRKVGFCFLYSENPDDARYLPGSKVQHLVGVSYKIKVKRIERIIKKFDVKIVQEYSIKKTILNDIDNFLRVIPETLTNLHSHEYKNAKLGLGIASSLISKTQSIDPDLISNKELIKDYLYSSAVTYEKARLILLKLKPKEIITFNGRFACAKAIIEAARQLSIPVSYHERGATYDKFYNFRSSPHDYKFWQKDIRAYWFNSTHNDKYQIGHTFFQRRRSGDGIGWTSFSDKQDNELLVPNSGKKNFVYYSSSDFEFSAVEYNDQYLFDTQRDAIKALIAWASDQENDILLTIRVHPNMQYSDQKDRDWWCNLKATNVQVIPPDSRVNSYALLDQSDIVLSYGSTMGIEAAYWGKPSILLGNSGYSGFECCYEPQNVSELFSLLERTNLEPLPQESCLPYGYYMVSFGEPYQYYQPQDLFSGYFHGQPLSPFPVWFAYLNRGLFYINKLMGLGQSP